MEEKFLDALVQAREQAMALGVRLRPVERGKLISMVHRCLSQNRESDGFGTLQVLGRLDLTPESLAVNRQFTALFSDDEANTALNRLLSAGYRFTGKV